MPGYIIFNEDNAFSFYGVEYQFTSYPNNAIDLVEVGYGQYRFWTPQSNFDVSFTLDLRDANIQYPLDIGLKWDGVLFFWKWIHAQTNCPMNEWNTISFNDSLQIWDIWDDCSVTTWTNTSPNTAVFQPTTPENFTYINVDNNPKISWDASEPYHGGVTYTLYRKDPGETEFSVIASNLTVTQYLDTEVEICCGNTSVTYQYKVVATSGDGSKDSDETDPLNVKAKTGEVINTNKKEIAEIFPGAFSIQAYPNPFNPTTKILYDIPEESNIKIIVFDLMGRKIKTLQNGFFETGSYSLRWEGNDENSQSLSSGMYIINISARSLVSGLSFNKNQKVVLIK